VASHTSRTARAARSRYRPGGYAYARARRVRLPVATRTPRGRVAAAGLRPTRLPPAGCDGRSCRSAHRRLADRWESAYVQATRARNGTDWYLARDQLSEEGHDPDRITRLAERMNRSRAHTHPSPTEKPRPSVGPQPRPATPQPPDSSRGQAHATTSTRRARSRHRAQTLTGWVASRLATTACRLLRACRATLVITRRPVQTGISCGPPHNERQPT
jgi:hypothetical protein